jgi:hypothetical protein
MAVGGLGDGVGGGKGGRQIDWRIVHTDQERDQFLTGQD